MTPVRLPIAILLGLAVLTVGPSGSAPGATGCSREERALALRREQRAVLEDVGGLTSLGGPADLALLAAKGYDFYPHQFVSIGGQGVAVLHVERFGGIEPEAPPPVPGHPTLLLYAPAPGSDATDPRGPDFPYRLVGWGYLDEYDYDRAPTTLPCIERRDWFAHERGVHPFDSGGMEAVPPEERFHGQDDGRPPPDALPPDLGHGRFWDLHLFLGASGVPTPCLLHPTEAVPGIDPEPGVDFFYPPSPPGGGGDDQASGARDCRG